MRTWTLHTVEWDMVRFAFWFGSQWTMQWAFGSEMFLLIDIFNEIMVAQGWKVQTWILNLVLWPRNMVLLILCTKICRLELNARVYIICIVCGTFDYRMAVMRIKCFCPSTKSLTIVYARWRNSLLIVHFLSAGLWQSGLIWFPLFRQFRLFKVLLSIASYLFSHISILYSVW